MKTKKEIVANWLPRYTSVALEDFGQYIILTNFQYYVTKFAEINGVEVIGINNNMPNATANDITIINFGMGSPNAATVVDLLTAIKPKGILFIGKCGGLKKKNKLGDFILPIAAIRGDGTSDDYLDPKVPALPAFAFQKAISTAIRERSLDYWTGTVFTTNRRVWEHDKPFKDYLKSLRAMAIDMETATIFITAFKNKIPAGALLLVTDQPMIPEGVKTEKSDKIITQQFTDLHLEIAIESIKTLINKGETIRHLRF